MQAMRALHVDRAAAVQHAVGDVAGERRMRPRLGIAGRHHVGVAGEHQMRRARADAGVEVLDIGGARLGEGHPVHGEARALQQRFEKAQRAAFRRRHRRAAQQIAGDGDGIGGRSCSGFIRPCAAHVNSRFRPASAPAGLPSAQADRGRTGWDRWCRAGNPARRKPRRRWRMPTSPSTLAIMMESSMIVPIDDAGHQENAGHDIEQHQIPAGLVAVMQALDADGEARDENHDVRACR